MLLWRAHLPWMDVLTRRARRGVALDSGHACRLQFYFKFLPPQRGRDAAAALVCCCPCMYM
jgi:hypothetical protein